MRFQRVKRVGERGKCESHCFSFYDCQNKNREKRFTRTIPADTIPADTIPAETIPAVGLNPRLELFRYPFTPTAGIVSLSIHAHGWNCFVIHSRPRLVWDRFVPTAGMGLLSIHAHGRYGIVIHSHPRQELFRFVSTVTIVSVDGLNPRRVWGSVCFHGRNLFG
jgi:hypothetical protein